MSLHFTTGNSEIDSKIKAYCDSMQPEIDESVAAASGVQFPNNEVDAGTVDLFNAEANEQAFRLLLPKTK